MAGGKRTAWFQVRSEKEVTGEWMRVKGETSDDLLPVCTRGSGPKIETDD